MSEFFQGVTFANQNVTPVDDAILRWRLLSDGVLTGCELTYAGYTLTMASGYLIACGRQIRRPTAENWAISDATSGYARVLMTIDLTRTATEEVFDQVNTSIEYATAEDGFPALIQDDINATGSKYQVVLAIVSLGTGGITGIASCLAPARSYGSNGSNYNLLDNSDFRNPVNQRGQTSYTEIWGYTIDRWYLSSGDSSGSIKATVTLTDGGLKFTPSSEAAARSALVQRLPQNVLRAGVDYTIVAKKSDGDYLFGSIEDNTDSYGFWQVVLFIDTEVTLEWAALYEGEYTAETLPEYQPKGYGAELAECQRYYLHGVGGYCPGLVMADGTITVIVPTPVTMRTTPAATAVFLDNAVYNNGVERVIALNSIAMIGLKPTGVYVVFNTDLTSGKDRHCTLMTFGTTLHLSADL